MNIHNNKEYKLKQLKWILGILGHIKPSNNSSQPIYPEQLQQTKHREDGASIIGENTINIIEGNGRQQIEEESSFAVAGTNDL